MQFVPIQDIRLINEIPVLELIFNIFISFIFKFDICADDGYTF